ncbi:glycosyltransferase family 2 protein [Shewanella xiamenensis]|uniref:glycosyltransferase family 2 protein n=1 Tax=Shewanella xiamenensis TaxID=332186 RepID=UPI000849967B|nr:glycosyltransferase [Shewanella xiamenensis]
MFSIVIPYYNIGNSIFKTLESLTLQTCQLFEVIIIDDGSIVPLQLDYTEYTFNIRIIRTPNQGVSVARNTGASLSNYDWLVFLDAGDFFVPRFIERMNDSILKNPNFELHTSAFSFGENGGLNVAKTGLNSTDVIFDYETYLEHLCKDNFLFHICSMTLTKELFFRSGGFSPKATHGEDHEFILKALKSTSFFMFINKSLFIYSLDDINSATRKRTAIPVYTHTLYLKNLSKRIQVEDIYFINSVVDNLIVNSRKGFFINGLRNAHYSLPISSYGRFVISVFKKVFKYARK